jgi:hypothetical protein
VRPDAAHPRRVTPPSKLDVLAHAFTSPATSGIHGWTTPDGPDLHG